jgi:hypothetical protein
LPNALTPQIRGPRISFFRGCRSDLSRRLGDMLSRLRQPKKDMYRLPFTPGSHFQPTFLKHF